MELIKKKQVTQGGGIGFINVNIDLAVADLEALDINMQITNITTEVL